MSKNYEITSVAEDIRAPIEVVWKYLSDFGAINALYPREGAAGLPPIDRVEVVGQGQGAVRTIHLEGGRHIIEELESIDSDLHVLSYLMMPPLLLPVEGYRGIVSAEVISSGITRVQWRCEGTVSGQPTETVRSQIETLYQTLIAGARSLSMAPATPV